MAANFIAGALRAITLIAAAFLTVAVAAAGLDRNDRWTDAEKAVLASMTLAALPAVPSDPSNAVESDPRAIELGRKLFSEARLSKNGEVACATCHAPDNQFQDGRPVGKGVGTGARRTMPIAGAAYSPWLFWDGRKDSLWSQALGPLEDAAEHGGNRLQFAHVLNDRHKAAYEAVFGPMPSLAGLPKHASPLGDRDLQDAWNAIPPARRDDINRVFANLGKAIAAYERTIQVGASRFDAYVAAVQARDASGMQTLSPQEVNGLRLFVGKGQCSTCHNGPLLTDQAFHNTGVPPRDAARPDRGRAPATARVANDEFNCLGRYSDAPADACTELRFMATDDAAMEGAFKTPSLRNVALRAPYMHAGQFATLDEVIAHYVRSPAAAVGHSELAHRGKGHAERQPIRLSEREVQDLAAFLRSLSGQVDGATLAAAR
jgi:cytochrome c peroxidase